MNRLARVLPSIFGMQRTSGDSDIDSVISERDHAAIKDIRDNSEQLAERFLQDIAMKRYGVRIKAAVFKRVKSDRGHMLALLRADDANSPPIQEPTAFLNSLVETYNAQAMGLFYKSIDYAVWSYDVHSPSYGAANASIIRRKDAA